MDPANEVLEAITKLPPKLHAELYNAFLNQMGPTADPATLDAEWNAFKTEIRNRWKRRERCQPDPAYRKKPATPTSTPSTPCTPQRKMCTCAHLGPMKSDVSSDCPRWRVPRPPALNESSGGLVNGQSETEGECPWRAECEERKGELMELQQRDKDILTLCYEQRFLLIKHISQYFFRWNYSEAKRRVRELKEAKLMQDAVASLGRHKVLELTKEGRKIADSYSRIGPLRRYEIDHATLEHNAYVTEARLLLQKYWDGYWVPEHALVGENLREIPDGLWIFEESEKQVVIEVENSLKGRTRFENRIKRWFYDPKTAMVIFIATKHDIYHSIGRYLESAPQRPLFMVMTLENLKSDEPWAWSPYEGQIFPFNKRAY